MQSASRAGILVLAGLTLALTNGARRLRHPAEFVSLVLLATTGLLVMAVAQQLLLAFLALLACAARAARTACAPARSLRAALAQGVAGSLIAFAITAVWHPLLVRGIGLPLVFLLALAYHLTDAKDVNGI